MDSNEPQMKAFGSFCEKVKDYVIVGHFEVRKPINFPTARG